MQVSKKKFESEKVIFIFLVCVGFVAVEIVELLYGICISKYII